MIRADGYELAIQKEARGYTAWLASFATGSKVECLAHCRDKRECRRAFRRYLKRVQS